MKYLVIGNKGQLGLEIQKRLNGEGVDIDELDITNIDQVQQCLSNKFDFVFNCAAYNLVDKAEKDFEKAYEVNALGIYNIGLICKKMNSFLIHYSSDYVFDGSKFNAYDEKDKTNPLNTYGKSKRFGEMLLENLKIPYLCLRTSWLYGNGQQNFIYKLLEMTKNTSNLKMSLNEISVPTSTKTLVDITIKALQDGLQGVFHAVNSGGYVSRCDYAMVILSFLKKDVAITPVSIESFHLEAKRPVFSVLSNKTLCDLGFEIPDWQTDLKRFLSSQM